ncbi:MAG: type I phosphomannose isomerase catalytic subunit [Eubacteriales bacterium]
MEMKKYPLKLSPAFKEIIWGGDRLKKDFGKVCDYEKLAESWELTCRYDGMNVIENGEYAGMTLGDYLGDQAKGFPLLIKLIDACDRLSIQVHPDDAYAKEKEGEFGKTEMWYIVDADPGAKLVYGLKDYDKETFAAAAKDGTLEKYLNFVEVHKGDVFFIPSGCVHAIGAGILIAEIQQSSNVTYRVYDYNRVGKDGKLRPLHVEKALDVIVDYTPEQIEKIRFENGKTEGSLANCKYFKVDRLVGEQELHADDSFLHVLCLDGEGTVGGYPIKKGDSYYLPQGIGTVHVTGNPEIITSKIN